MTTRRQFLQGIIVGAIGAAAARAGLVDVKSKETTPDTASRTLLVIDENGDAWKDATDWTDWEVNEALKTCELGGEIDRSYMSDKSVIVPVWPSQILDNFGIKSEQVRDRITELREGST